MTRGRKRRIRLRARLKRNTSNRRLHLTNEQNEFKQQPAREEQSAPGSEQVRDLVRQAIEEFVRAQQKKAEPAYKAELMDERKRRENLETRLNQLVEENRRAKALAEEADRSTQIRSELQR